MKPRLLLLTLVGWAVSVSLPPTSLSAAPHIRSISTAANTSSSPSFMFTRSAARLLSTQSRAFSTSSARQTKVAVLGAGGGIGQPLSLLLKIDPLVSSLSLYDIRGAPGVAADVSHIDTDSSVCCLAPLVTPVLTMADSTLLGQGLHS
jgi:hypothetical protein